MAIWGDYPGFINVSGVYYCHHTHMVQSLAGRARYNIVSSLVLLGPGQHMLFRHYLFKNDAVYFTHMSHTSTEMYVRVDIVTFLLFLVSVVSLKGMLRAIFGIIFILCLT